MSDRRGVDLINESFGQASSSLSPSMEAIRSHVVESLEEHLLFGGRIRPLTLNGTQWGYVRGVYTSERAWINRMFLDPVERLRALIQTATTLPPEKMSMLTTLEIRRLILLIHRFSKAEMSLFQWVSPFVTTSSSERLWYARSVPPRELMYPGGLFKTLAPSDLFHHWAFLAASREDNKESLRALSSSSLIVRAYVGRHAQSLTNDVQSLSRSLQPNIADPWKEMGTAEPDFDPEDGWGHIHQDSSLDGLMRELNGMLNDDKHEQLMRAIAERDRRESESQKARIRSLRNRIEGVSSGKEKPITPYEMRERINKQRQQEVARRQDAYRSRVEMLDKMASESPEDRAKRIPWDIDV